MVWLLLALIGCGGGETAAKPGAPAEVPVVPAALADPPAGEAALVEPAAADAPAAAEGTAPAVDPAAPVADPAAAPAGQPPSAPVAPASAPPATKPAAGSPSAPAPPAGSATPATPASAPPAAVPPAPAAAEPAPRGASTYKLAAKSSWVYVVIKYDRNTLIAGHDHAARATELSGTVVWDPADATKCKVDITIPVRGLKVDTAGLRKRAGLEGDTPADDLPKIEKNMLSSTQLDAERFPDIRYRATSCGGTTGKVKVTGELTLRGVTKPVTTTMTISEDGAAFSATGTLNITHTQFGFKPFVAALGALKNEDALKLVLELKGAP
jgi:polyisoprenoid-binding protein YceI